MKKIEKFFLKNWKMKNVWFTLIALYTAQKVCRNANFAKLFKISELIFFPKNALAMPFFRLITFWTAQKVRKLEKFAILWDMRDHSSQKIELICLKMPFLRQNTLYNFHQKRKNATFAILSEVIFFKNWFDISWNSVLFLRLNTLFTT